MPRIHEDKIDEIRSSINIVNYINQYINLKKAGKNYKGLCPFHTEKTSSFVVSPEKQIFHCFGCGKGGNLFTFMMDYEKLSFMDAVSKAAEYAGIAIPRYEEDKTKNDYFQNLYHINEIACTHYEKTLFKSQHKARLKYFLDRKISESTIKIFRLGYAPDTYESLLNQIKKSGVDLEEAAKLGLISRKEHGAGYIDKFRHRIIFPFFNISGKIVGFGGRKLREEQQPKYLNSPESPIYKKGEILYGLNFAINAIREKEFVFLVEGYFDLLRLYESGYKNVVASSGTALTETQAKLIRRYTKDVYIVYDGDSAGIKAAIRNAYIIEKQGLNASIVAIPGEEDPDSFILSKGEKAFDKLIKERQVPVQFQIDQFFYDYPTPGIEQKQSFSAELLDELVDFDDQIKIGIYIQQLSEKLQINESMLVSQLNRIKRNKSRYSKLSRPNNDNTDTPAEPVIRAGLFNAEMGLIGLLLQSDAQIRNFIIENASNELFENESTLSLYEHVIQEIEDTGIVNIDHLMIEFKEDETRKNLLSEIALTLDDMSLKFARDCVYQLRKRQLDKKAVEIQEMIKNEADSEDSVEHYSK
ncbi:MAG TPA: DNA primase, partial [Caldithrix sp.]|nr:DNA primase [Caldithrix sp.]